MKNDRSIRHGCLMLLAGWAFLCLAASLVGRASDADERVAPFAGLGILVTLLFALIYGVVAIVRRIKLPERKEPRGFPVLPINQQGKADEGGRE